MGARTLAKALTQSHGGSIENNRRAVIRWLQGSTPVERNRRVVEQALGLPDDALKADDEDDEDSLLHGVSLEHVLRLHIRRLLRDELVLQSSTTTRRSMV